jgi:hypothetical protein
MDMRKDAQTEVVNQSGVDEDQLSRRGGDYTDLRSVIYCTEVEVELFHQSDHLRRYGQVATI